jgi:hypothetical protein
LQNSLPLKLGRYGCNFVGAQFSAAISRAEFRANKRAAMIFPEILAARDKRVIRRSSLDAAAAVQAHGVACAPLRPGRTRAPAGSGVSIVCARVVPARPTTTWIMGIAAELGLMLDHLHRLRRHSTGWRNDADSKPWRRSRIERAGLYFILTENRPTGGNGRISVFVLHAQLA